MFCGMSAQDIHTHHRQMCITLTLACAVYVASVCLSNQSQLLQALVEADKHHGPSFVCAYAPCIQQQVRPEGLMDMFAECRIAVESGYWPLYRYNPALIDEGKNVSVLVCCICHRIHEERLTQASPIPSHLY